MTIDGGEKIEIRRSQFYYKQSSMCWYDMVVVSYNLVSMMVQSVIEQSRIVRPSPILDFVPFGAQVQVVVKYEPTTCVRRLLGVTVIWVT